MGNQAGKRNTKQYNSNYYGVHLAPTIWLWAPRRLKQSGFRELQVPFYSPEYWRISQIAKICSVCAILLVKEGELAEKNWPMYIMPA